MTKQLLKISRYKPSIEQAKLSFAASRVPTEHPAERLVLFSLGALLALLVFGYLYFVTGSILNVIARKEALSQINVIQGEIGGAEQQYFALTQGITPTEGASLGLVPVTNTTYVYRQGNVAANTPNSAKAGTIAVNAI